MNIIKVIENQKFDNKELYKTVTKEIAFSRNFINWLIDFYDKLPV